MQLHPLNTCLPYAGCRAGWMPSLKAGLCACLGCSLPAHSALVWEQRAGTGDGEMKTTDSISRAIKQKYRFTSAFFGNWKRFGGHCFTSLLQLLFGIAWLHTEMAGEGAAGAGRLCPLFPIPAFLEPHLLSCVQLWSQPTQPFKGSSPVFLLNCYLYVKCLKSKMTNTSFDSLF